jgi:prevent-host-death family protein
MEQRMAEDEDQVTAAEFEAKCLQLIDEAAKRRTSLVITKDGKPWVRVVPSSDQPIDIFGCMAGTMEVVGDIISPIDEDEWTGDADNI